MSRLVISPRARVRWVEGEIEFAVQGAKEYLRASDPDAVALLNAFAVPRTFEEVGQAFDGIDAADLKAAIDGFKTIGVLVSEAVRDIQDVESAPVAQERPKVNVVSWDQFYAELQERRAPMEYVKLDDLGLTASNCGKENLSRGCQACKNGGWVCFYPGFKCNAHCNFCPQPADRRCRDEDSIGTGFVDDLLVYLGKNSNKICGLSVSGGETLLYLEPALKVLSFASEHLPDAYLWAYTNGIAANPEDMRRLRDAGLEELRFDLAATRFNERILDLIAQHAVSIFPWVTVEVPSVEDTYDHLVNKGKLRALADMGVKQLNLAQLCIPEQATTSPAYQNYFKDGRSYYVFDSFKRGGGGDYYSVESRRITYDILEYAHAQGIDIRINDCSSEAKEAQRVAREMTWGSGQLEMKLHSYPYYQAPPDVAAIPDDARRTRSGLAFKVLSPGQGERYPGPGDYVTVNYTGWTSDGLMFDSSMSRDSAFTVSLNQVIPGWAEGVQGMVTGEKRRLWVPEKLAYAGQPGRPQGMLVFEIELLEIL